MARGNDLDLFSRKAGDSLWSGRLISDTKIRLTNIMSGRFDELFFRNLDEIIESKLCYEYIAVSGRKVVLSGMKDFIFNLRLGLGIRDADLLMSQMMFVSEHDKTEDRISKKIIDHFISLGNPFNVPDRITEYRRLLGWIKSRIKENKGKDRLTVFGIYEGKALKNLFQQHPDLLKELGPGRKYKNLDQVYIEEGLVEFASREITKQVRFFNYYSREQSLELSQRIYEALGKDEARVKQLIRNLITVVQNEQ